LLGGQPDGWTGVDGGRNDVDVLYEKERVERQSLIVDVAFRIRSFQVDRQSLCVKRERRSEITKTTVDEIDQRTGTTTTSYLCTSTPTYYYACITNYAMYNELHNV
jgi:hypothetical protein